MKAGSNPCAYRRPTRPKCRRVSKNNQLPCRNPFVSGLFLRPVGDLEIIEGAEGLLARRWGKIRYKPQGHGELIQLEVRTKERNRTQRSWLSRYLHYFNACLAQRPFRLCRGRRIVVRNHIVRYPLVQE